MTEVPEGVPEGVPVTYYAGGGVLEVPKVELLKPDHGLLPLAYRGKQGCQSVTCSRLVKATGGCYGWHCVDCDQPCSMQGHHCPERESNPV